MKKSLIFALVFITFSACYNFSVASEINAMMAASPAKISEVLDECIEYAVVDEVQEEDLTNYLFICVNDILTLSGFTEIIVLPELDKLRVIFSSID